MEAGNIKGIHFLNTLDRVNNRVDMILELMGLSWVKTRVIPEDPDTRGTVGGELRRLSIAMAIFDMPAVIVASNPLEGLDFAIAMDLMERLKALALTGRVVVVTSCKPDPVIFNLMSSVVVLSDGYRIFEGKTADICTYFCSDILGYQKSDEISAADFVLHIADGTERPIGERRAQTAAELWVRFNSSGFMKPVRETMMSNENISTLLPGEVITTTWGNISSMLARQPDRIKSLFTQSYWKCVLILTVRAFTIKSREYAVLRKSAAMSLIAGLFIGYFCMDQGNFGKYCMALFNFPYNKVSNIASMLFIINAFCFITQLNNIHVITQKVKVFKAEQKMGITRSSQFLITSALSEIPFAWFFTFFFVAFAYQLIDYKDGVGNFSFFIQVNLFTALMGIQLTYLMACFFGKEFIVRDLFLFVFFTMVMISGFPFTITVMRQRIADLTFYNPLRWTFQALMYVRID